MAVLLNPPSASDTPTEFTNFPSTTAAEPKPAPPRPSPTPGLPKSLLPTEYKLEMQNSQSRNLFVFGEREEELEDTGEVGHRKRRREWQTISRFGVVELMD